MRTTSSFSLLQASGWALMLFASSASAADLKVIFSEITSSPTSIVPGAVDAAGNPAFATWAVTPGPSFSVNVQSDEWVLRWNSTLASTLDGILVRGTGMSGTMFMQEGRPLQGTGGEAGETYSFFDSPPASWNAAGDMALSYRAAGGITGNDEKLATFIGGAHAIILSQGSPITGLANGCATLGNSIGGFQMLDTGEVAFGNTPLAGCSSTLYYPALFRNNVGTLQNNITAITSGQIGEEVVDGFSYSAAAFTLDGLHYAIPVTTNNPNTAADRILLVDTAAVMREGQEVVSGSGVNFADVFAVGYAPNDDLYVRGDDPADNDWCVRNGVLIAATGQPITTGNFENWGNAISAFTGNSNGDYIVVGNTSNGDINLDTVIVRNNTDVLVREGDPVDFNGNGQFDDDMFIRSFNGALVYLTDANILYFMGTVRNAAGTNLGDVLMRADVTPEVDCPADLNGDTQVNVSDLLTVITSWGACVDCPKTPCAADIAPLPDGDCQVSVADLLLVIASWGACP